MKALINNRGLFHHQYHDGLSKMRMVDLALGCQNHMRGADAGGWGGRGGTKSCEHDESNPNPNPTTDPLDVYFLRAIIKVSCFLAEYISRSTIVERLRLESFES